MRVKINSYKDHIYQILGLSGQNGTQMKMFSFTFMLWNSHALNYHTPYSTLDRNIKFVFCKQIGFLLSQQKFCNRPFSEQVTSCIRASYSSCFKNNKVEKDTNPRSDSSHCLKRDFWVFFIVCFFNIQLLTFAYARLLNRPYENEVILRGQNIPLKCS